MTRNDPGKLWQEWLSSFSSNDLSPTFDLPSASPELPTSCTLYQLLRCTIDQKSSGVKLPTHEVLG